jgi:hypothetical protein
VSKLVRVLASTALLVSIITLFTRLVGFLRWLVFSPTVGAGTVGTAYQSANQVPNILFEVVAGGALAGAVIPLLAIPLARADRDTAGRIASALLTWAVSVTLPLSIILAVLAPEIADILVDANTPDSAEAQSTAQFLLMFSPQLVLYGIGAVLTGVLQAHRKFLWPAFAPLLSSLVVIGSYVAYSLAGGTDDSWQTHIGWLGWGTTLGVAALALPLALPMRSTGLRIRPTFSFPPGVAHRALRLAGAGMAALLAQQAAVLVTLTLSNHSGGKGTFVLFSYINAVYLLPYAVLAVPVATVMFPALSTWVGRTRTPEATEAERIEAGARLRGLTSTTTALILAIGGLGAVILLSAAGPLQTFFTAIDAAKDVADVPFDSMGTGDHGHGTGRARLVVRRVGHPRLLRPRAVPPLGRGHDDRVDPRHRRHGRGHPGHERRRGSGTDPGRHLHRLRPGHERGRRLPARLHPPRARTHGSRPRRPPRAAGAGRRRRRRCRGHRDLPMDRGSARQQCQLGRDRRHRCRTARVRGLRRHRLRRRSRLPRRDPTAARRPQGQLRR